MALFAFTPLAWQILGSPDESYPEVVFFGIGLPSALVATVTGALAAYGWGIQPLFVRWTFLAVSWLGVVICVLLLGTLFLPAGG